MTRLLLALVMVAGCVGCGGEKIRSCWNEYEGQNWSTNGKIVRTCCQDALSGGFIEAYRATGPVTCTPTIVEPAR